MNRKLFFPVLAALLLCGCAKSTGTGIKHYAMVECTGSMSGVLACGDEYIFELEENMTTGYAWEAEYDAEMVSVQIEHTASATGMAGAPGKAIVTVAALAPGRTEVVFRCIRPFSGEEAAEFEYLFTIRQ